MDHRNPDTWTREFAHEIERVREYVATLHAELPRWGLVVWTAGNVSQRVRGEAEDGSQDLLVIKPSGVSYDDLSPEAMVVCDLDGNLVLGEGSPSSDTAAHAYVYRHMSEVGGVVHTHSTYATAWAARGEEIPCVLTMMGDEFGGPVPVGPFALIGDDSIGRDARAAVKAAVMVEEVAKTVHVARAGGPLVPIEQHHIDSLYDRYQNVYGQH